MYKRARSYTKFAPVAVTSSVHQTNGQQGIWLKGREFVADITGTVANGATASTFSNGFFVLRPTDYTVFSWLASIALKFNNYKFRHLAIVYEPTCPSTTGGSVGLYYDPDPSNTGPANWQAFVNTGANTHGAPWMKHGLVVPYRDIAERKEYYTKSEYPNLNSPTQPIIDPLEHFPGIYGVCAEGIGNGTQAGVGGLSIPCGKIYIEYAISLWKSMSDSPPVTNISSVSLNPAIAENSGVGMVVKVDPDVTVGTYLNAVDVFGTVGGTTFKSYKWAGFGYFTRDSTTYELTCISNVELHYCYGVTAHGANPGTVRFVINGTSMDPSTDNNLTVVRQEFATGTNPVISCGRLKLKKGDKFCIRTTFGATGADGLRNYYLSLTPSVFGIYV